MLTRHAAAGLFRGVALTGIACFSAAHAGSLGGTAEENRAAIDACKLPAQQVSYVVASSRPKAIDAPATADEDQRVRSVMAAAGVTYDRVNRRAAFEMVLDLVRANGVIRFQILPNDGSTEYATTKNCLAGLANDIGAAAEFVSNTDTKSDAGENKSGG
jgi:hypothetical protein